MGGFWERKSSIEDRSARDRLRLLDGGGLGRAEVDVGFLGSI